MRRARVWSSEPGGATQRLATAPRRSRRPHIAADGASCLGVLPEICRAGRREPRHPQHAAVRGYGDS
jgi:hypothetical protein